MLSRRKGRGGVPVRAVGVGNEFEFKLSRLNLDGDSTWTRPHEFLTSSSRQNSRRPGWPVAPSLDLFALFGCFVTFSSRHPSRAPLTRRPGCLGGMCSFPPSLLHGVLNIQALQALLVFSDSFRTTPFSSNPGVPPWYRR